MRRTTRAILLAAALLVSAAAGAQDTKPQPSTVDPKVRELLQQVTAAYKALTSYRCTATLSFTGGPVGEKAVSAPVELRILKPNRLYLKTADPGGEGRMISSLMVSNGVSLWRWNSATNTYVKQKAPAMLAGFSSFFNAPLPEGEILIRGRDPFQDFPKEGAAITLGAPEKVGEVDVDVIEIAIKEATAATSGRVLVGRADRLIRGFSFEIAPGPNAGVPAMKLGVAYRTVTANPALTPADFRFVVPAGARLERGGPVAPAPRKPAATTGKKRNRKP